jgi:hypothetical protein
MQHVTGYERCLSKKIDRIKGDLQKEYANRR